MKYLFEAPRPDFIRDPETFLRAAQDKIDQPDSDLSDYEKVFNSESDSNNLQKILDADLEDYSGYEKLNNEQREKWVEEKLKSFNNQYALDKAYQAFVFSDLNDLSTQGIKAYFNLSYGDYLKTLGVKINGPETKDLIHELITTFKINKNTGSKRWPEWLNTQGVYAGADKENAYRVKLLATADQPKFKSDLNIQDDNILKVFSDEDGRVFSTEEMVAKYQELKKGKEESSESNSDKNEQTGKELLKTLLQNNNYSEFTLNNLKSFYSNIIRNDGQNELNSKILAIIDSDGFIDIFKKVASKKYVKDFEDENLVQEAHQDMLKLLTDVVNKKSRARGPRLTGLDLLKTRLNRSELSVADVRDYVQKLISTLPIDDKVRKERMKLTIESGAADDALNDVLSLSLAKLKSNYSDKSSIDVLNSRLLTAAYKSA